MVNKKTYSKYYTNALILYGRLYKHWDILFSNIGLSLSSSNWRFSVLI
jgi:hypothetical protein